MDLAEKKKSASFGNPAKASDNNSWFEGAWPESGNAPRKTACFDDSVATGTRSRGQYTFGGVDIERLRATIDAERKISTGGSGLIPGNPTPNTSPQKQLNINDSDVSFQERDSVSKRNIYNVVKEEMEALDQLPIFADLCDKSKYSTAKVCKISGQKGKFKNW